MIQLCTVSDKNYLVKGLTLYESLIKNSENIVLHYLCIDKESLNFLKKFESPSLIVYDVEELTKNDNKLENLKQTNYKYFCWALASYFSNYLMKKNIGNITYIDSDIFFHENIEVILNEIGDKEIGVFRHRQFDMNSNPPEGLFNVGVVHFKNGKIGRHLLNWWCDAVLYMKYHNLATCGDQKYLDEFLRICPDDYLFIDGDIGHGAPWQWQLYDFSEFEKDEKIIWNGKKQKLIFTHFSQFDFKDENYIPSLMHHCYTPLNLYVDLKPLKKIYDNYYQELKNTKNKYYGQ
jgi:hypothetical protein